MDLKYNCGFHNFKSCTNNTGIFEALIMMADTKKDLPKHFVEKISGKKILERLLKTIKYLLIIIIK